MKKNKYSEIGSEGVSIIGNINSEKDIAIQCNIKGNIECKNIVMISCGAEVEGNIKAKSVIISDGTVKGDVTSDSITVCELGTINGDIYCKTLQIDEGGCLKGKCSMEEDSEDFESLEDTPNENSNKSFLNVYLKKDCG